MSFLRSAGFLLILCSHLSYAVEFTNHLGMQFKTIPVGTFMMGSCKAADTEPPKPLNCLEGMQADPEALNYEFPAHQVTLNKTFQMAIHEVTLELFQKFMKSYDKGSELLAFDEFNQYNGLGRPVVYINWNDVKAFIDWLNKTKPASDTGIYRLPTEAEWEYAARAGTKTAYWWGNSLEMDKANCVGCDTQWGGEQSSKVGQFPANPFGLYDMNGNVGEWLEDCWHNNYLDAPHDGSAWMMKLCAGHVIRGGAWSNPPWSVRSAARNWNASEHRDFNIGFRVVREETTK